MTIPSLNNGDDNKVKEYSIKAFSKDYHEILINKVLPMLAQYEPIRIKTLIKACLGGGTLTILGVLCLLFVDADKNGNLAWALIGSGGAIWFWLKKQFENKIKRKVMPILMNAVPNFRWQEAFNTSKLPLMEQLKIFCAPAGKTVEKYQADNPIHTNEITQSMIFPYDKNCIKTFDDCFIGKYRDVGLVISECTYKMSNKTVFSGAIIRLKMNKNFEGMTILRPKKHIEVNNIKDLKKAKLQKIELEDIKINKMYHIYSTDQIEARYLLTTAFIERFQNIALAFNSKVAFCVFHGDYVYIAPYCKKDLFSVGSLVKPVADEKQFNTMFEEFVSILELVDHFKLDKKLGL